MRSADRFEIAAIGIDGDQAFRRRHVAERRRDSHAAVFGLDARDLAVLVEMRAGLRCRLCRADHELHRLDMAGALVVCSAQIARRPKAFRGFSGIHVVDMRIAEALRHQFRVRLVMLQITLLVHDGHLSRHIFDVDLVRLGKFDEVAFRFLGKIEQAPWRG